MSIVYIISLIAIFITFLYVKKSDKELDLVTWLVINTVLLFCYNTLVCYIYTMINISINLISLSVLNYIISFLFIVIIINKKRQEYKFYKKDLIFVAAIIFVTLVFAYLNFGFPINIKYVMTDSGVHFNVTNKFFQDDCLLGKKGEEIMPGAYSNAGILMKAFSPYIEYIYLYKVFICFDIFMFFLTGLLMYVALKQIIKSEYEMNISVIFSIIYMIGYPLNVLLFGYFYLQLGIIIFSTIIIIMEYFKKEIIDKKYLITMLFLLCLELFFSYYLFVPVVYGGLFIYYLFYFYKKNNKLINKELIIFTVITLIIPCIIGFIYSILPGIISINQVKAVKQISLEGYIYRNIYSNIILFVPFVLIYIAKLKKSDCNLIVLILLIFFMCLLYIGCLLNIVSTYYFYKTYFILWFLVIYLSIQGMVLLSRKSNIGKIITTSYTIIYIIILLVSLIGINVKVTKETTTDESLLDVMEIYGLNKTILIHWEEDFNTQEIEILKYVKEELEISDDIEILILGEPKQEYWFWGMLNYKNREDPETIIPRDYIDKWNKNEKFDYLICFNRSKYLKYYKDYIDLNKEIIYVNESGTIYKNK